VGPSLFSHFGFLLFTGVGSLIGLHSGKMLAYSSSEKGCRKKVQKCTRQSRKVQWVFPGNSEKMAHDTMDVC